MRSHPNRKSAVSSIVGGLILTLIFISMIAGLMVIQMEHRSYLNALRDFQSKSYAKAKELLKAYYEMDSGKLRVTAENPSPLTVYVRYVVISRRGSDPLVIPANHTVPPGTNNTVLIMALDEPPSSVKIVTSMGNVFEASSTRHVSPPRDQDGGEVRLEKWPGFTSVSAPTSSGRMIAVSDELIAWSDGKLLAIYDWHGRCLSSLKGEVDIRNLAVYSNIVVFIDGESLKAIRGDGLLLWVLKGFNSRVRPYLTVEDTGTIYVKRFDGSNSYISAVDVNSGKVLLSISYPERWPYLRSDGKLTVINLPGKCVRIYSRGKQLASLAQGFTAAWIDAGRGLVALWSPDGGEGITIHFYDLSFNYRGNLTIKPPVESDRLTLEDLEFTKGGFALYYMAYLSYDYYCYVACADLQGRATFNDLVTIFDTSPPLDWRGCFREYFTKVNSFALYTLGRPRIFNASLIMELPPSNAIAATKIGRAALIRSDELTLTQLLSNPGSLPKTWMEVDRSWVLLRNGGPCQKVGVKVGSEASTINVSLDLVSVPPGLSYEITSPSGQTPLTSTITLSAGEAPPGNYVVEVVAKVSGEVVDTQLLSIDVRLGPTLVKESSTMEISAKYSFLSTTDGFEAREISVDSSTNLNISARAVPSLFKGWGGVVHEVHVPEDLPGTPYVALRIEDQYGGLANSWEKRIMVFSDGSWHTVWSEDLADESSGLKAVQVNVGSYANPGEEIFIAIALARTSSEATIDGAWIRACGIGLPGSSFYKSGYYLTMYAKDCLVVKGVLKGQIVEVYGDDGSFLGSAEAVEDGEVIVNLLEGALSPYRRCILKIHPVDGTTWTSNAMLIYGGDILAFTG